MIDESAEGLIARICILPRYHLVNTKTDTNEVEYLDFFWAKIHRRGEGVFIVDTDDSKVLSLIERIGTDLCKALEELSLISVVWNLDSAVIVNEDIGKCKVAMSNP